ncbi:MAG: ABC transporter permease [Actinomycetota bacterium]|nr:ABC transporter permease [Acidimicrobiia bacterium]MDQ3294785.1 ABC transporter permease [Actinomycetota bacterium]
MAATILPTAPTGRVEIRARKAGFLADLRSIAGRAVRSIPREPEAIVPALLIPLFFFVVNTGSLQDVAQNFGPGFDYKAFQLPVAIVFAVTGISRASTLVTDIQNGYFDRLQMTPVSRLSLLLGLMVADFVNVLALSIPVLGLGLAVGVDVESGVLGALLFLLLASLWGLAFTGFPYAIALKTGNPAAVNSSFLLFFPFAFLTTSFVPQEALTSWLGTTATYNPVTYLLDGLRSLLSEGWDAAALGKAIAAIAGIGVVSIGLALAALRGRVDRG